MKVSNMVKTNPLSGEQQIKGFIAKFEPKQQALIRSVRKVLRARFPTANELVYDYPNAFVMAWSPTTGGADAVVGISANAEGVRLVFTQGAMLADPKKILQGSGRMNRFVPLESLATLRRPDVEALMKAAVSKARVKLRRTGTGELIIKS